MTGAYLLRTVDVDPFGCWTWTAATHLGYGVLRVPGTRRNVLAHRASYEAFVGPIPAGLQVDHLCRNRACVNPSHLEPVTRRVNILRGIGVTAANARKTHCAEGHPYDEANTLRYRGHRTCRVCANAAKRRAKATIRSLAS